MSTPLRNEYFGPYKLIRSLGDAHGAQRFVVLCTKTDTNYMLYRFEQISAQSQRRKSFETLIKMSVLDHSHLLKIQSATYDDHARLCVITPYTGNHDGLVTIDDLLELRDGKLGTIEAIRALEHLLSATAYAHAQSLYNGALDPQDILVDRYGSLQVQLYGFEVHTRDLDQSHAKRTTLIADEIRSIIDLGYTMMTGLSSRTERIAPSRVIKKIDRAWDAWFEIGLDPIDGFESVQHAINSLPTSPESAQWLAKSSNKVPQVHIGSMLRRFRSSSSSVRSSRK